MYIIIYHNPRKNASKKALRSGGAAVGAGDCFLTEKGEKIFGGFVHYGGNRRRRLVCVDICRKMDYDETESEELPI